MTVPAHLSSLRLALHAAQAPELEAKALHASALPSDGGLPEWVQLTPAGEFSGVDGRGPYRVLNADQVIARSREISDGHDLMVDYGHDTDVGQNRMKAEAAGWMTALESRNGGEIWAKIDWTAPAAEKIRGKIYRGISPVLYHDAHGVVQAIARAGLTNVPNLRIKSLNAQTGNTETEMSDALKAFRQRLVTLCGMTDAADDDALFARCKAAIEAESGLTKVAHALKLEPKTVTPDGVITALQSVQTQAAAAGKIDATKYVPIDQYNAVASELQKATQSQNDSAVDEAIKAGKITPANREWAKSLHSTNPQAFADFIRNAPVLVQSGTEARERLEAGKPVIGDSDKAVMAQLEIPEAEYSKTLGSLTSTK